MILHIGPSRRLPEVPKNRIKKAACKIYPKSSPTYHKVAPKASHLGLIFRSFFIFFGSQVPRCLQRPPREPPETLKETKLSLKRQKNTKIEPADLKNASKTHKLRHTTRNIFNRFSIPIELPDLQKKHIARLVNRYPKWAPSRPIWELTKMEPPDLKMLTHV